MQYNEWYEIHWRVRVYKSYDEYAIEPGMEKYTDQDEAENAFHEMCDDKDFVNVKFFRQSTVELGSCARAY